MSLSAKIREQLISSFRADLTDHVQAMTDGLLALEQDRVSGDERQATLADIFRAAHSLKGAARAVGVTAVEQVSLRSQPPGRRGVIVQNQNLHTSIPCSAHQAATDDGASNCQNASSRGVVRASQLSGVNP